MQILFAYLGGGSRGHLSRLKGMAPGQSKTGYNKIWFCGQQTERDGLQYFLGGHLLHRQIKTLSSFRTLLTLCFRWLPESGKMLRPIYGMFQTTKRKERAMECPNLLGSRLFRESRWFTRGWTLSGASRPAFSQISSQKEGKQLGDKRTLERQIHKITGITSPSSSRNPPMRVSASRSDCHGQNRRQTTRKEDKAYSLFRYVRHFTCRFSMAKEKTNAFQSGFERRSISL